MLALCGVLLLQLSAQLQCQTPDLNSPHWRDYSRVDAHARNAPQAIATNLNELAEYLAQGATNEAEKARAIFSWLAHNIAYDVSVLGREVNIDEAEPRRVLNQRKTFCSGYVNLFLELAAKMGLKARESSGYGRQFGEGRPENPRESNHSWMLVTIDGKEYPVDPTWGAGVVNGSNFQQRFSPFWFCTPPELFVINHLPGIPRDQLLAKPIIGSQFQDYLQFTGIGPAYFYGPYTYTPKIGSPMTLRLKAPLAQKAMVVNNDAVTTMTRRGDTYEATVTPTGSKLMITLQHADRPEGRFDVLAIYKPRR